MENKILWYILIGGLTVTCWQCSDKTKVENEMIQVEEALPGQKELLLGDYFTSLRYLPLETHDSCLIGRDPILYLFKDHILVNSNSGSFLFDKHTGRFIRSIGHIGNDPGGYKDRFAWIDTDKELIYYNGWENDYIIYDLSGDYLGKLIPPGKNRPRSVIALGDERFIGYCGDFLNVDPERILFFDKEGQDTLRIVTKPAFQHLPMNEVVSVSALTSNVEVEYGPVALQGVVFLKAKDEERGITLFPGYQPFWQTGSNRYFKEEYNDTIYRIESDRIIPDRIFHLGSLQWPPEERLDKRKGKGIYISQVLEGENLLLFRFIKGMHSDDMQSYLGVYSKRSGEASVGLNKNGFKDNLNYFLPVHPVTVAPWGEYAGLLSADDIREWMDEASDISSSLIHLKEIKEDDNPVIVLMNQEFIVNHKRM